MTPEVWRSTDRVRGYLSLALGALIALPCLIVIVGDRHVSVLTGSVFSLAAAWCLLDYFAFLRPRLEADVTGVRFCNGGAMRDIAWADIIKIEPMLGGVRFHLRDGRTLKSTASSGMRFAGGKVRVSESVAQRLAEMASVATGKDAKSLLPTQAEREIANQREFRRTTIFLAVGLLALAARAVMYVFR